MSTRFLTKLLIVIVILIAAFFFYRYLFVSSVGETEVPGLEAVDGVNDLPGTTAATNDEFIRLLERLQGVKLNSDLFASPAWKSLINFRVELVPEPKHRRNPFAPIGSDSLNISPTTTTNAPRGR